MQHSPRSAALQCAVCDWLCVFCIVCTAWGLIPRTIRMMDRCRKATSVVHAGLFCTMLRSSAPFNTPAPPPRAHSSFLPAPARSCPLLPAPARSCPFLPVPVRSCPLLPGPARSCALPPAPARGCPAPPHATQLCPARRARSAAEQCRMARGVTTDYGGHCLPMPRVLNGTG